MKFSFICNFICRSSELNLNVELLYSNCQQHTLFTSSMQRLQHIWRFSFNSWSHVSYTLQTRVGAELKWRWPTPPDFLCQLTLFLTPEQMLLVIILQLREACTPGGDPRVRSQTISPRIKQKELWGIGFPWYKDRGCKSLQRGILLIQLEVFRDRQQG